MSHARDVVVALALASAGEALLVYFVAPEYMLANNFSRSILRLVILNVLLYGFYSQFIYPFFVSPLRDLPRPKANIFYGNFRQSLERPVGSAALKWHETIPNGGAILFRGALNDDRLSITTPEALKAVLSEHSYDYEKPKLLRDFLSDILGHGLLMVEGNEHKFQRKHLTPAFTVKQIRNLYPAFWDKSRLMVEQIEAQMTENDDAVVELNDWATRATLDIIGTAGLGRDFGALRNPEDELVKKYNELLEPTMENTIYFALSVLLGKRILRLIPWHLHEDLGRLVRELNDFALGVVHERQKELKSLEKRGGKSEEKDILTLLVQSGDFKDTELADQFLTFIAAGHETTSSSLTWVGYLLAKHPDIQKRLREEIRANLPSLVDPSAPSPAQIDDLPLLNAVCNETIRLYPAVPATIREAVRDSELPLRTPEGDLVQRRIPKGTRIQLTPWAVNRSTAMWGKDAAEFVPERWLGEGNANTGGQSSNYALITFLHGPRSCIGQGFARSELKCLVAALVGRFEFEMADPNEEVVSAGVITTKPKNGVHLRMKILEGW